MNKANDLRPKVSIVKTAGIANKKLRMPNPKEARIEEVTENPDSLKIPEEKYAITLTPQNCCMNMRIWDA